MKRLKELAVLMVLLIVLATVLVVSVSATTVDSSYCGENLTWALDDTGTLTISGTGAMWDSPAPWGDYRSAIKTVVIENGVTSIGDFSNCANLKSVTIPNSVKTIRWDAFSWCTSLENVKIPDGVRSIGDRAFKRCTSLESITIPDSVISIGYGAFSDCSNLNYNIYDTAKYLGNAANPYVALVESVTDEITSCQIHSETKVISEDGFSDCTSLERVTIPDGIVAVGSGAFFWCDNLNYNVYDNGKYLGNISNPYIVLIEATSRNITSCEIHSQTLTISDAFYGCINLSSITIPDSVITIGENAFFECGLISAKIGNNVRVIGDSAFNRCDGLTSITIPDSVTTIGAGAFYGCNSLISATIPEGITTIEESTFNSCENLTSITIPGSVTSIEAYAFGACNRLSTVFYNGTKAQRNNINIAAVNDELINAQWKYAIEEPEFPFADISTTSWQFASVNYALEKNLMAGKGTDAQGRIKFDPNSPISREEFVQVLYNAEGKPSVSIANIFPDVAANGWYKNAVLWANSQNIANGMGNGNFGVGKSITRQDLALMLYKYAAMKNLDMTAPTGEINKYADGSKVSGYAQTAMNWAVKNGVLSGKGTAGKPLSTFRLDPTGTATRAECAAMLKNFMTAFGL